MTLLLGGHTRPLVLLTLPQEKRQSSPLPARTNLAGDGFNMSYVKSQRGARPDKTSGRKKMAIVLFHVRHLLQGKDAMTRGTGLGS